MTAGRTSHQIARELNVSTQTIRNWTDRYPIEVEVEEESSKRIYSPEAVKQLVRINYLKENVDELIRKELVAATPSYDQIREEKRQLFEEVRKWKRAQENLLMNNEILLGKKREIEADLKKKNMVISQLLQERDDLKKKMGELTEICEKIHEKATDYQERWGKEQKKTLVQILWERLLSYYSSRCYSLKNQTAKQLERE